MPHHYSEPQPWYLAGTFRALLGRNCNAGDTGDTGNTGDTGDAGDAGTGDSGAVSSTSELCKSDNSDSLFSAPALAATLAATIAFAFAFAFALACSTKGANSLSNSELDSLLDISWSQLRALSALAFCAGCAIHRLLLWPNCRQFVHFVCFLFRAPFRILFTLGRPRFFAINRGNMFGSEERFSIDSGGIATSYVRRYDLSVYAFEKCS
jgi:hypothetical protein